MTGRCVNCGSTDILYYEQENDDLKIFMKGMNVALAMLQGKMSIQRELENLMDFVENRRSRN